MKLRHKISLLAGAVLLLVLLTCAGVLLLYARKTILALAEDQARDKQSALSASFSSMVRYYAVPEDSDAARESLIRYCFTRFADQEGVLMRGGETLCSSVAVDPSLYALPDREDSRTAVYRGSVDGRQLLIVASLEWVQTDTLYAWSGTSRRSTTPWPDSPGCSSGSAPPGWPWAWGSCSWR